METKEQLINHVRKWIEIDEGIRKLQNEIKKKKVEQKDMSSKLMNVMKDNEIDCFDLSDGKLMYTKNKIKQPINKKLLMLSLQKYFKSDDDIQEVTKHIMDSRGEKIKENIKRKIDKNN